MISFDEALDLVRAHRPPIEAERVCLERALARRLAEKIFAPRPSPTFDNSAMDGYAVASSQGPWNIVQSIAAGSVGEALETGQAARIFTGASVPCGVWGVLAQEDARVETGCLHADAPVPQGGHIRRAGEEFMSGDQVLSSGIVATPPVLSALASLGLSEISVRKVPRVLLLVTGSELLAPGEPYALGRVYDSNSIALRSALQSLGCEVETARVEDDLSATVAAIREAERRFDLVLSIGGVSVGDFDFVRSAMEATGFDLVFQGVAIKPGKPVTLGVRKDGKAWFGLPGNPMSALVTMALFVLPYLREDLAFAPCRILEPYKRKTGRQEFVPAVLERDGIRLGALVGSHAVLGLSEATGLAKIPADASFVPVGSMLEYATLPWAGRP